MKTATFFLVAAGVAAAQNLEGVPACAAPCISSAIAAVGCDPTDLNCQCVESLADIGSTAVGCLLSACTVPADLSSAAAAGTALCSDFLVSLTAEPTAEPSVSAAPSSAEVTPTVTPSSGFPSPSSNGTISSFSSGAPTPSGPNSPVTTSSSTAGAANVVATPLAMLLGALGAMAL